VTSTPELRPVVAVVGATGTGKSALALELAHRFSGEVVNADSMQVYRGMDIGTAKLPVAQRQGIPHHLLDIWPIRKAANVAEYQTLARAAIEEVYARGRLPILVGGSGLYVRAVLEKFDFPGHDPQIRARIESELDRSGPGSLHARLAAEDPAAAAQILPTNTRRLVRALEVIELTGGPFVAELPASSPHFRYCALGLAGDRLALDEALARRVERMWDEGFVAEVIGLPGLAGSPTASRALGYRQILAMLAGEVDEATAKAQTIRATRKFARRQDKWFRRDASVHWLDIGDRDLGARAQVVVRRFLGSSDRD